MWSYTCTSFSHTLQLFRKSSWLTFLQVSTATTEITSPFVQIPQVAPDFTQSQSQSPCDLRGHMWYLRPHSPCLSDQLRLPPSGLATLSLLYLRHMAGPRPRAVTSGCYTLFSRCSRGETFYILQCFAYISLFNEDNLAHSIKNETFISINLSSFLNFSFSIVLIFCQIIYLFITFIIYCLSLPARMEAPWE